MPDDRSLLDSRADLESREPDAELSAEPGAISEPDLSKTSEALKAVQLRSVSLTILLVLALVYTLYFARDFLQPIVFAVLLSFLLTPVVRSLGRLRIPTPAGATLVILFLLGAVGGGIYELSEPAQGWMARAPATLSGVSAKLRKLSRPVEQVSRTAEQIETATKVPVARSTTEVVLKGPSLLSRLFGTTQSLLAALLEILVLLYFLLAVGDLFLQKLIKMLPLLKDKKKAVQIARETEDSISTYLSTAALVNLGEGIVLAVVLWLLGMPSPVLWGALAFFLEFVPYIGALTLTGILTLAALTSFESVGQALLVPGSFLAINLIQGNLITPMILGHRLTLNPVAIIVGLAFWWWLWGLPGAFIAVPLLATFKIFCDHIESLAPVGEFLGK